MITLYEAIGLYLSHVKLTKSPVTHRNYESTLHEFAKEFFGQSETVAAAEFGRLMKWVQTKSEGCSKSTMRTYITQVKSFFGWCVRVGYLERNPAEHIGLPKVLQSPDEVVGIDREDRQKLLGYARLTSKRNYAILMFMASSGCRVSACANLTIPNLDLEARKARVIEKGNAWVSVLYDVPTAVALRDWLQERPDTDHGYVFVGQKPYRPLSSRGISQMMARLCVKAGCSQQWSPHSLRHAVGQDWSRNPNASVVDVQNKLNHKSPITTQRVYYAQSSPALRQLTDEYQLVDRDDDDDTALLRIVE